MPQRVNQPGDQSVNQSVNQSMNQPVNQSAHQSSEVVVVCCLQKADSPANRTGFPQGFNKTCTLHKHKTCTLHKHQTYKHKTYKHKPKVGPFGSALVKKKANIVRRCWYHWTI